MTAFRVNPSDIGVFDIASFAMNTVGLIDLKSGLAVGILNEFVNTGRTKALFRAGKETEVFSDRDRRIFEGEMTRLVFFVMGVGASNVCQTVKSEDAIRLGIFDGCELRGGKETLIVRDTVSKSPRTFSTKNKSIQRAERRANELAPFPKRFKVAHTVKFAVKPRILKSLGIGV